MKFLVDAQLPRRFCLWIEAAGHDSLHTLDLPKCNLTPDDEIIRLAEQDDRIVITKDDDFVRSFIISGQPPKLLLVSTGNISNAELEILIRSNFVVIAAAFESSRFVEIGRGSMVVHE